mgnify:FL=1
MINILKSPRFYIPIVTGYLLSALCPMTKNDGADINARPPAYVFGIVWPILYLLLGYSWVMLQDNENADLFFGINTLLGMLWLYTYSCNKNKKQALYVLLAMLLVSLYLLFYSFQINPNITYFIIPYTVWLIFALMLNFKLVNMN